MNVHTIDILVKVSGTVLGGVILWLLKSGVQSAIRIRDDVHDLKTNHVPHLQQAVEKLEGAIHDLAAKIH